MKHDTTPRIPSFFHFELTIDEVRFLWARCASFVDGVRDAGAADGDPLFMDVVSLRDRFDESLRCQEWDRGAV